MTLAHLAPTPPSPHSRGQQLMNQPSQHLSSDIPQVSQQGRCCALQGARHQAVACVALRSCSPWALTFSPSKAAMRRAAAFAATRRGSSTRMVWVTSRLLPSPVLPSPKPVAAPRR
jgi:hypothetical protein